MLDMSPLSVQKTGIREHKNRKKILRLVNTFTFTGPELVYAEFAEQTKTQLLCFFICHADTKKVTALHVVIIICVTFFRTVFLSPQREELSDDQSPSFLTAPTA